MYPDFYGNEKAGYHSLKNPIQVSEIEQQRKLTTYKDPYENVLNRMMKKKSL